MALMKHISFRQVFFAILLTILAINGVAGKGRRLKDSPWCAKTAWGDERNTCNWLVNGAPTWDAALTNVVKGCLRAVEPIKPVIQGIGNILPGGLKKVSKDSIAETCKQSVDSLVDDFYKVIDNLHNGDPYRSINTELSAASSSLSDCTDGLAEFSVNSPDIMNIKNEVQKYANIALAVAMTRPQ